jgi:integrase
MSRSTGSVEQVSSSRWRVRMSLAGVGRKTIDNFASREEAEAQRAVMVEILKHEEQRTAKTVLDFGEEMLTLRERGGHISDPGSDWSRWNNHIKTDEIANRAIKSMRDIHVEDWLDRLNAKGISRQTRLHCLNLLRVVMHRAKKKRLIKENPCVGVRLEVEKRTIDPWTFATPEEQDAIIAATPKPLDAIVEFAIGTGMRSGEMAALRIADVHVEGPDPYVTVRYGGPPDRPTKWGRIRQIPLFGRAMAALRRWLDVLPSYAPKNPHGLLFPAHHGGFRNHDHLLRWGVWKGVPARGKPGDRNYHAATIGVLERAGITRPFRWHDLRHTCASSLISGWWGRHRTLKEVCDLLGHRSITTTERYAHLADTALKQAARETVGALSLRPAQTSANSAKDLVLLAPLEVFPSRRSRVRDPCPAQRNQRGFRTGLFGRGTRVEHVLGACRHDERLGEDPRLGRHRLPSRLVEDGVRDVRLQHRKTGLFPFTSSSRCPFLSSPLGEISHDDLAVYLFKPRQCAHSGLT